MDRSRNIAVTRVTDQGRNIYSPANYSWNSWIFMSLASIIGNIWLFAKILDYFVFWLISVKFLREFQSCSGAMEIVVHFVFSKYKVISSEITTNFNHQS